MCVCVYRSGKCGGKCHNKTYVAPLGDRSPDYYTGGEPFMGNGGDGGRTVGGFITNGGGGTGGGKLLSGNANNNGLQRLYVQVGVGMHACTHPHMHTSACTNKWRAQKHTHTHRHAGPAFEHEGQVSPCDARRSELTHTCFAHCVSCNRVGCLVTPNRVN